MHQPCVVRFAPSPTGPPHLGNLRTALFDWLLARATGGRFILRVDDTDRRRFDPEAEALILESVRWLGLEWDEGPDIGGPNGPYRQSERLELYHAAAERLIAQGQAYRPPADPQIVRLKTPLEGVIRFQDFLRGPITFEYRRVPRDPVLIKSDGFPTYHLATVVDDHAMGITHVLRGEEWIPSTPIHLQIIEALGYTPPIYVHLPLVVDANRRKLAKRDPRSKFTTYRDGGYLPAALINYLALLGWHPGIPQEVFTLQELAALFTLERISPAPAMFDEGRLRRFNRQHVARLTAAELAAHTIPLIRAAYPQAARYDDAWLTRLTALVADEITLLTDVVPAVQFAFDYSPAALAGEALDALNSEAARPVLTALRDALAGVEVLDDESSRAVFKELRDRFKRTQGWGGKQVMFPARAALTGSLQGPHLSDVAALLGPAECRRRLDAALDLIGS
ncbi:MAG: glutamate--tRNA ligase [Anaerolineae bacterium]